MSEEPVTDTMAFTAEHVDVGLTIETRITLNGDPIVTYRPGTKHMTTAQAVARQVLIDALAPLIAASAEANDCRYVDSLASEGNSPAKGGRGPVTPFPYQDDEIAALVAAAQRVAGLADSQDPEARHRALEALDRAAHAFCIGVDSRWAGVIELAGDAGYVDDDEDPTVINPALRHAIAQYKEMIRSGRLIIDDPPH